MTQEYYRYKITVDGQSKLCDNAHYWSSVARMMDERGYHGILERQLVTDDMDYPYHYGFIDSDFPGMIRLKDKVLMPWEVIAEIHNI